MVKTKNARKQDMSGIFWLGVGLIGVIIVVSALFKY